MKKRTCIALAVLLSAAAIYYCVGPRRPIAKVPGLAFLSADLKKQELAVGTGLQVDYTHSWAKLVRDGKAVERREARLCYRRSKEVLRFEEYRSNGTTVMTSWDRVTGDMRRLEIHTGSATGETASGNPEPVAQFEIMDPARYPLYEGPLCERIACGTLREGKETIDGHECSVVDLPSTKSRLEKYVVWLDPSIGCNPRRIDFLWSDKRPKVVVFREYVEQAPGLWFPKRLEMEYGSRFREYEGMTFQIVMKATQIQVDKDLPKNAMLVVFPSGTVVRDGADTEHTVP